MNIVIATIKNSHIANASVMRDAETKHRIHIVSRKEDLTREWLDSLSPDWVFFPHWSWIIPESIYSNHRCVVFHMTDLPFGRGGSPLQNLIVWGIRNTKISAIRVVGELDAGDIYMKSDLSLEGTAEEILERTSYIIFSEMIPYILRHGPEPVPQEGTPTIFKRRTPKDGDIGKLEGLDQVYDYIRMLDGEGYPQAYLNHNKLRLEFSAAQKHEGRLTATVSIRITDDERNDSRSSSAS